MMLEKTGVELLSPHSENFGHNIYIWKKKKKEAKSGGKVYHLQHKQKQHTF